MKRSRARSEVVADWLEKLAEHFSVEVTEGNAKLYADGLRQYSEKQIVAAFKRCLSECQFMPKLSEVRRRIPEAAADDQHNRLTKELMARHCPNGTVRWTEGTRGTVIHYVGSADHLHRWVERVEYNVP